MKSLTGIILSILLVATAHADGTGWSVGRAYRGSHGSIGGSFHTYKYRGYGRKHHPNHCGQHCGPWHPPHLHGPPPAYISPYWSGYDPYGFRYWEPQMCRYGHCGGPRYHGSVRGHWHK